MGNAEDVKTGVFKFGRVEGLSWRTETLSGETGPHGEFQYRDGETVTFGIGRLNLGSVAPKAVLTPADLSAEVAGDIKKIRHRKVTNIARLLESLGKLTDEQNAIVITPEVRSVVDKYWKRLYLNQPEHFFAGDSATVELMAELGVELASAASARNNLRRAMNGIVKECDVRVPLRDGGYVLADIYRPDDAGTYPVIMSFSGYGKAFWYGKTTTPEEWERSEQMEDDYFQGNIAEQDFISFQIGQAGEPPIPDGTPGVPPHGSKPNPMMSECSEHFERANVMDWVPSGYVVMHVDSRGLGNTPGRVCQFGRPEAEDYYDTIEWAGIQPWSNGAVGIYGGSFYAITAVNVATLQPPHLKAMIPLCTDGEPYRDLVRPGGLVNKFIFTPDIRADEFKGTKILPYVCEREFDSPEIYNEQAETLMRPDLAKINIPFWTALPLENPFIHVRGTSELWNEVSTPLEQRKLTITSETGVHFWMYGSDVLAQHKAFFDKWLKGADTTVMEDVAPVRVMIREGYAAYRWIESDQWPLPDVRYEKLYLQAAGETTDSVGLLAPEPPAVEGAVSYPADANLDKQPPECVAAMFVTPPMEEDLVLAGHCYADLYMSTTSDDLSVLVKVVMLDEDNEIVPVAIDYDIFNPATQGALKASHRKLDPERTTAWRPYHTHLAADAQKLTPGEVVDLKVELLPMTLRVKKGWKLAMSVAPLDNASLIDPQDTYTAGATDTLHTGGQYASFLQIPVIDR